MTKFTTFLQSILSLLHKFFAPAMFHKKKLGPNGIRYAGHLTRFSTIMLDLIIYTSVLYFISTAVNIVFDFRLPIEVMEKYKLGIDIDPKDSAYINKYFFTIMMTQILQFIALMFCNIFTWYKYGSSPAKLITGIVILDEKTLSKPTFKQCIKRFFALAISVLPLFLGIIWIVFDKKGQSWHDKISGTVVVLKSSLK